MITTAAFLLAASYEACHNDDYDSDPGSGMMVLVLLVVFMWFDYSMAQVIA